MEQLQPEKIDILMQCSLCCHCSQGDVNNFYTGKFSWLHCSVYLESCDIGC